MQDYNTIIGAIQMRLNKCPTRSVMDRFRIGSSTLNLIMSRYKALELTIDELEAMSPKKVENLFYPQKNLQRKEVPLPDFQYYYDRIHAPNSRVNISFCWLDYKEKNPDGYEKSQFYEYYQRFVQENYGGTKISMAVNRKPGEKMYIDWVGDQPGLLTDVTTGEIMRVAEEAARKCIEMNSCRYSTYRQVLKKMECDEHPESSPESLPSHENIRGKDYYK